MQMNYRMKSLEHRPPGSVRPAGLEPAAAVLRKEQGSGVQLRWAHRPGGLCSTCKIAGMLSIPSSAASF